MTGQFATFEDGAGFDDGAGFVLWTAPRVAIGRPRHTLIFRDGAARRPGWVWGTRAEAGVHYQALGPSIHTGEIVAVQVAHVARARPYRHNGRVGYLLERPDGTPMALVDAQTWIEATR